jgi:hypothetical protein
MGSVLWAAVIASLRRGSPLAVLVPPLQRVLYQEACPDSVRPVET